MYDKSVEKLKTVADRNANMLGGRARPPRG
jgi:hypothetical protein